MDPEAEASIDGDLLMKQKIINKKLHKPNRKEPDTWRNMMGCNRRNQQGVKAGEV